ncbi:hypothetical protein [Glycomyces tarimensis]
MGTGFGVDPDQVVQHAGDLRAGVFAKLENAMAAAEQVGIGDEAYGMFLSHVIPPTLRLFLEDAGTAIEKTVAFGEAIEGALTGTAMDYYAADAEAAAELEKMAEAMEA